MANVVDIRSWGTTFWFRDLEILSNKYNPDYVQVTPEQYDHINRRFFPRWHVLSSAHKPTRLMHGRMCLTCEPPEEGIPIPMNTPADLIRFI